MEHHNPHVGKVVDLVDPYITIDFSNQGGKLTPPPRLLCHWLDTHPGRWAMTAEGGRGTSETVMRRLGYQVGQQDRDGAGRHFARLPHPQGETLREALKRSAPPRILELPDVERDPFDWTPEELADATECALANLFPGGRP